MTLNHLRKIGHFKHGIKDLSAEYHRLSKEDELAAEVLQKAKQFRQACYFIIQSMEKSIRSKIFTFVNPDFEYFRKKNQNHSLESAVEFLIEIVSTDPVIRQQVSLQISNHVLGNTKYSHLHNNLRYPSYFEKFNSYSVLDVGDNDYTLLKSRLHSLRRFLMDINKLV